jgi:uncharacterized membrane protein
LRWGALFYAGLGVCGSIYFMYIQFAFIHAFCIYCLISAVLTVLLLFAAIKHFSATGNASSMSPPGRLERA